MNRSVLTCALMVAVSASLLAQQAGQSDAYQGTSNPPPDDTIVTSAPPAPAPLPKPSPAHPVVSQPAPVQDQPQNQPQDQPQSQAQTLPEPQPASQSASARSGVAAPEDGTDDGIVQIAPDPQSQPGLNHRAAANDPDGDIVHPAPLGPGELGEGATIRVRLLERLSTTESQTGETFRTRVASDVLEGGQVLIPAGSEIDGKITYVSSGTVGGHGSMHLNPDTVILPGGARYRLYAQVTATPGSNTRVGSEGAINAGSRMKRDGVEYGGGVGAGALTGAALGGPAGALAGSLVGAGLVTAHLLISHPQANLEEGTVLIFTLTERLHLEPAAGAN